MRRNGIEKKIGMVFTVGKESMVEANTFMAYEVLVYKAMAYVVIVCILVYICMGDLYMCMGDLATSACSEIKIFFLSSDISGHADGARRRAVVPDAVM